MRTYLIASVLVAFALVAADAFDGDHVFTLTDSNFSEKSNDGTVNFIKFYAPWCGHCKRLAPTWNELGEAVGSNSAVRIANVDCTTEKNTCQKVGVRSYPTLKVFHKGAEYKTYKGARDLSTLKTFIEKAAKDLA